MLAPSGSSYAPIPEISRPRSSYPSDIDDAAWELIAPILARSTPLGRPRVHADRLVYNAIVYVLRGGIAWRMLPKSFPPWQTVYGRFRTWADNGTWEKLTRTIREKLRVELGRKPTPSAGVIDSQSVLTGPSGGAVGYDAGKHIRGRKRHLVVDTEGFLVAAVVTPANVQDPTAGYETLALAKEEAPSLRKVWADGRYRGKLVDWAKTSLEVDLEIVSRPPEQKGFAVLPRRWVVERSIAWLDRCRRLARDWEAASWSACALVHIAASNTMARRLARYQGAYLAA